MNMTIVRHFMGRRVCDFKKLMPNNLIHRQGFITLMSVVVAGILGLGAAVSLLILGLSSSRSSFNIEESALARSMANACAEEALEQVRSSPAFTGSGNLTLGDGNCSYLVLNLGGSNRLVQASGTFNLVVRKVEINLGLTGSVISISNWEEVGDF